MRVILKLWNQSSRYSSTSRLWACFFSEFINKIISFSYYLRMTTANLCALCFFNRTTSIASGERQSSFTQLPNSSRGRNLVHVSEIILRGQLYAFTKVYFIILDIVSTVVLYNSRILGKDNVSVSSQIFTIWCEIKLQRCVAERAYPVSVISFVTEHQPPEW